MKEEDTQAKAIISYFNLVLGTGTNSEHWWKVEGTLCHLHLNQPRHASELLYVNDVSITVKVQVMLKFGYCGFSLPAELCSADYDMRHKISKLNLFQSLQVL